MDRVKVNLPAAFNFSTTILVRITDLNYGGHVGNNEFLAFAHEARQQYLKHFGYSELNFEGVGLIMADAAIEYKKELKYADEVVISVAAANFDRLGFDVFYLFETISNGVRKTAAKIKTGMTCFNYETQKKASVPAEAIQKLQNI